MTPKKYRAIRTFFSTIELDVTADSDNDLRLPKTASAGSTHEYLSVQDARVEGWHIEEIEDPADYQYWTSTATNETYVYRLRKDVTKPRSQPLDVYKHGTWALSNSYTAARSYELQQLPLDKLTGALAGSMQWQNARRWKESVETVERSAAQRRQSRNLW